MTGKPRGDGKASPGDGSGDGFTIALPSTPAEVSAGRGTEGTENEQPSPLPRTRGYARGGNGAEASPASPPSPRRTSTGPAADPPAVFVARFVPAPGAGFGDVNARRKRLLKLALRACGLRCVGVAEEPRGGRSAVAEATTDRPP